MKLLRQTLRGCTSLPHVGEHPGTLIMFIFILMGGFAGAKGGFWGFLGGASFMALFIVPCYLVGAYSRAQYSDQLERIANPK